MEEKKLGNSGSNRDQDQNGIENLPIEDEDEGEDNDGDDKEEYSNAETLSDESRPDVFTHRGFNLLEAENYTAAYQPLLQGHEGGDVEATFYLAGLHFKIHRERIAIDGISLQDAQKLGYRYLAEAVSRRFAPALYEFYTHYEQCPPNIKATLPHKLAYLSSWQLVLLLHRAAYQGEQDARDAFCNTFQQSNPGLCHRLKNLWTRLDSTPTSNCQLNVVIRYVDLLDTFFKDLQTQGNAVLTELVNLEDVYILNRFPHSMFYVDKDAEKLIMINNEGHNASTIINALCNHYETDALNLLKQYLGFEPTVVLPPIEINKTFASLLIKAAVNNRFIETIDLSQTKVSPDAYLFLKFDRSSHVKFVLPVPKATSKPLKRSIDNNNDEEKKDEKTVENKHDYKMRKP